MREQTFFTPLLVTVSGLLIWAAHFTLLYAINALSCERVWMHRQVLGMDLAMLLMIAVTLAVVLALVVIGALAALGRTPDLPEAANRRTSQFLRKLTVTVSALSLVAVVYQTAAIFVVPACG